MSYTVRAATAAAVSASISTPVCAVVADVAVMRTPRASTFAVTSTCVSISGWHIGISSQVRLAAAMPAMRATSRGSPLGLCGSILSTLGRMRTNACAVAERRVSGFSETSTIRARPSVS